MAGSKKRKHVSIEQDTTPPQHDIRSFAKVRKIHESHEKLQKCEQTPPPPVTTTKRNRKRKRAEEAEMEEDDASSPPSPVARGGKRTKFETPSKQAAALFNRLELDNKVKPVPFALNATKPIEETPKELDTLLQMNAAFLSALALYYAHNGTSSAVDVETLLPMITKHWKKRTVTLDDLQVMLAIGHGTAENFGLQDYGQGMIRLSKQQSRGRAMKRAASYVDETNLQSGFREALHKRWNTWLSSASLEENRNFTGFLDQLPRAEINQHESVKNSEPMFARGHQRLANLKASQAAANADSPHPSKLASQTIATSAPPQSRGTSLLDRILAKQALTASLPAGPTRQQLERKAALHRVEEIARVLDLLAAGRTRCSFGVQAVVQQLQQSLRNPISKEEVQKCLDVMGKEVTPGFVNVVRNGNVDCVVVTRGGRVGLDELRARVENALALN